MNEPTHLDLFSGIGGFAKAAREAGFRTIGFCEIDGYCRKVLAKNFGAENISDTLQSGHYCEKTITSESSSNGTNNGILDRGDNRPPILPDIFTLDGRDFAGVSLITGGFPCQPFSVAGKRRGASDDRAIWPEMFRVISEARPAWVVGENVPGIIPMELDNVLSDLEGIGYATRAFVIPACAVDARHRRDRVWIVGRNMEYAKLTRFEGHDTAKQSQCDRERTSSVIRSSSASMADPECGGQSGQRQPIYAVNSTPAGNRKATESVDGSQPCVWLHEPDVGRVAHGIPSRVHRLKGLGNAIVPQVAFQILRVIYDVWTKEKTNVHAAH